MAPPSPFLELSGDHDHQYDHLFNLQPHQTPFSSSSSLSDPIFLTTPTDGQLQGGISDHVHYRQPQNFQFQLLEADRTIVSYGGSRDRDHEGEIDGTFNLKLSISKNGVAPDRNEYPSTEVNTTSSVKWMSSKMRIMRKMTNPDQTSSSSTTSDDDHKPIALQQSSPLGSDHQMSCNNNNSSNSMNPIIRVCSDCNTTKTPLWRSGPRGPKSLCNACGIRQRKARRAMAAAAAAASGTTLAVSAPSMKSSASKVQHNKDSKPRSVASSSTLPFKKRCNKLTPSPSPRGRPKKICFEDFTLSMKNTNSSSVTTATTLQRVFPQDEKEAAILLMALSCGLVHG